MGLTKGHEITKADVDTIMARILNCRTKWGKGTSTTWYPTIGSKMIASQMNQYVTWLNDVKGRTKPSNSISVPGNAGTGGVALASWVAALKKSADDIYNHCHSNCHSNCNCNCDSKGRCPD